MKRVIQHHPGTEVFERDRSVILRVKLEGATIRELASADGNAEVELLLSEREAEGIAYDLRIEARAARRSSGSSE